MIITLMMIIIRRIKKSTMMVATPISLITIMAVLAPIDTIIITITSMELLLI